MKSKFALLLLMMICVSSMAQPLRINSIDDSAFPDIQVFVDFGDEQPQEQDVKIIEGEASLPVSLSPYTDGGQSGKALFILIENSGFTYGKALNEIKASVKGILSVLGPGVLVNIGYYGTQIENSKALEMLSVEFSTDYQQLISDLDKIKPFKDTTYRKPYTFKSIFEALNYMEGKTNLPGNSMLLVLSTAVNNDKSPVSLSDCSDKSIKAGIPFYGLTYKTANSTVSDNFVILSDRTGGQSAYVSSSSDIKASFSGFWEHNKEGGKKLYKVGFVSTQKKAQNKAVLSWNNQNIPFTFSNPNASKLPIPLWSLVVIGVLIVGAIAYLMLRNKNKNKATIQVQPAPMAPPVREIIPEMKAGIDDSQSKKDLKKTMIAGGPVLVPTLFISYGNVNNTLQLGREILTIGRNNQNALVIPDSTVSGQHAIIKLAGGSYVIEDLGSTNGTTVNGAGIKSHVLKNGDVIRMGAVRITFKA